MKKTKYPYVSFKLKLIFTGRKPPVHDVTLTSPDGEVFECMSFREKRNGKLWFGYFNVKNRRLVATYAQVMKERWKLDFVG